MKLTLLFVLLVFAGTICANPVLSKKHSHRKAKEKLPAWVIKKNLVVKPNLTPQNDLIKSLINKLESDEGIGQKVTKKEFLNLFNHPESKLVYKDKLIKYATPKSMDIQKAEHDTYTKNLLRDNKINEGVDFLSRNSSFLNKAENKYGVYKQDIVSILMWESGLGKYTGSCRIFNIFMAQILFLDAAQKYELKRITRKEGVNPLADSHFKEYEMKRINHRKLYAVDGLVALLRFCKEYNLDPLNQTGSWGGAIGYVQFMPFNLNYAVDADSNGVIDLNNWPDAIYSVANYLKLKGNYSKNNVGRRAAFFQYNHSDEYADGVMLYADSISRRIKL
jgi:membrane-bound lytic murein transglycosylase B